MHDLFVLAASLVDKIRKYQDVPQWDCHEWDDVCDKTDDLELYLMSITSPVDKHKTGAK